MDSAWIRSPNSVKALFHLATWVPDYLGWDEAQALATKAIWSLASIGTVEARRALESLSASDDPVVAERARAQLAR